MEKNNRNQGSNNYNQNNNYNNSNQSNLNYNNTNQANGYQNGSNNQNWQGNDYNRGENTGYQNYNQNQSYNNQEYSYNNSNYNQGSVNYNNSQNNQYQNNNQNWQGNDYNNGQNTGYQNYNQNQSYNNQNYSYNNSNYNQGNVNYNNSQNNQYQNNNQNWQGNEYNNEENNQYPEYDIEKNDYNSQKYDNQEDNYSDNGYQYNDNFENDQYSQDENYNNAYNGINYNQNKDEIINPELGQEELDEEDIEKTKSKKWLTAVLAIVAALVVGIGGYFGYTTFAGKPTVDMSAYEVEFTPSGNDGEGVAAVKVNKIPKVKNANDDMKKFLQQPKVQFDKNTNLKNGDSVEATLTLDENEAKSKGLDVKGEFKQKFVVTGLKAKNNTSTSSNNNSQKVLEFRQDSSKDTTKLEENEVSSWAKAIYIKDEDTSTTTSSLSTKVWLGSDRLVYVNVLSGSDVKAEYRVSARGDLEKRSGDSWNTVSSVYTITA